jgi:hypothetical protein
MAQLKTRTVLLDMLVFLTPAVAAFVAAFWRPYPILFLTAALFLLLYMRMLYLRLRG